MSAKSHMIPDAKTTLKGVSFKSATLAAPASDNLINLTLGVPSVTMDTSIPIVAASVDVSAANLATVALLRTTVLNNSATTATQLNLLKARLEDLILKQQNAGQQT